MLVSRILLLLLAAVAAKATVVQGIVYDATGRPANGQMIISWPAFTSLNGRAVPAGARTLKITSGVVSVDLEPTPPGTLYTVRFMFAGGTTQTESWAVPQTSGTISISQARAAGNQAPIPDTAQLGGDLTGTPGNAGVVRLQGVPVDNRTPSEGDALIFGSGAWRPAPAIVTDEPPVDGQLLRWSAAAGRWRKVIIVDQEAPSGQINGVNRIFTLAHTPDPPASVTVWRNGLVQARCPAAVCDYYLSGNQIQFIEAATPQPGDVIRVSYRY